MLHLRPPSPRSATSRVTVVRPPSLLSALLALSLTLAACSSPAPASAPGATAAPAQSSAAPAGATSGAAPANPAAKAPAPAAAPAQNGAPAAAPSGPGSSQAAGDLVDAANAPAQTVTQRSRTTGRPVTIEVWLTDWEQSTQALFDDTLVPAFEAANPTVAVNIQYLDWRVFTEKLIAAYAGGVLPDVFQAGAEYAAPLATKGMALNLDDYVAAWGQRDDFYDSAWDTVTYQGHTYGIPVVSAPQTLMYRKDMLAAAGVTSPPATWEDLVATAQKTTQRDGDKFLVTGFNAKPIWQQYVWFLFQNGGDVFGPDGKVAVNSPQAVEALDFFASLFNGDGRVASKSVISAPTANVGAMAGNLVAMQVGNQLTVRDFRTNNPAHAADLVIAEPPGNTDRVATNWTDWLAISKQSKNADAAWKFVSFVAEKDNLLKYNETMYFVPPRKSLRTEGYMADPQLQQFVTIMEQHSQAITTHPAALDVYQTILNNAVNDAVYSKKTPKQALDDAAKRIEQAIRRA